MRRRGLVIGLLIMLALVTSGFTYAFWAGTLNQADDVAGSVTIGAGGETTVSVTAPSLNTAALVPASIDAGNSVTTLQFPVSWTAAPNSASASGLLNAEIVAGSVKILVYNDVTELWEDSGLTASNYFTVEVTANGEDAAISVGGSAVNVVVTVTFTTEPATQAIYNLIANGRLTFEVSFQVNYEDD
jgi:hypothetical protein